MSELVGLDGKPLDSDLVTVPQYMERLGQRAGFDLRTRDFLRKNLPSATDGPPEHMSRSQRQIAALQQALLKISIDNLQLWMLVGAFTESAGGTATFDQATVKKFREPAKWPAVTSADGQTIKVSFPFADEPVLASQSPAPVEPPSGA